MIDRVLPDGRAARVSAVALAVVAVITLEYSGRMSGIRSAYTFYTTMWVVAAIGAAVMARRGWS